MGSLFFPIPAPSIAPTTTSTSNSLKLIVGSPTTLSFLQPNSSSAQRNILTLNSLASISPSDSLPDLSILRRREEEAASVMIRRGNDVGKRAVFKDITKRTRGVKSVQPLRRSGRTSASVYRAGKFESGGAFPDFFAGVDIAEDDASGEGVPDLIHDSPPPTVGQDHPVLILDPPATPVDDDEDDDFTFSYAYPHDQFDDLYTPTSYQPPYLHHHTEIPADYSQIITNDFDKEEQGISLYDQFNLIPSPEKGLRGGGFDGGEGVYGKFGNEEWEIRSVVVVEENGRATLSSSPPRGR